MEPQSRLKNLSCDCPDMDLLPMQIRNQNTESPDVTDHHRWFSGLDFQITPSSDSSTPLR
jgi:hypothetical protein